MATPTEADVISVASAYNIPPAVLMGVVRTQGSSPSYNVPAATVQAYGLQARDLQSDQSAALEIAARTLQQEFRQYGSWEAALSAYLTGDPGAYQSPTSAVGGQVYSILGSAATIPMLGLDGYRPADAGSFTQAAAGFGRALQGMSTMGGIVTPQVVQQYGETVRGVTANLPSGMDSSAHGLPAKGFTSHPFAAAFLSGESESFGQDWQGSIERGNDFGMPQGTPLTAAETGTVELIPWAGKLDVGIKVTEGPWAGWTIGYGHSHSLAAGVRIGGTVRAGQPLAFSGGDPSDPLAGMSSGPHVEFQLIDPQGNWRDPQPILQGTARTPQRATNPTNPTNPTNQPQGHQRQQAQPDPAHVSEFAAQLKAHNIDPGDFAQHFPFVAAQRRNLMDAVRTDVGDYADIHQAVTAQGFSMGQAAIIAHLRGQPHPTFPQVSVGQLQDAWQRASLVSTTYAGRLPTYAEAAAQANSNLSQRDLVEHYSRETPQSSGQPALRVQQGGQQQGNDSAAAQRQQDRVA